MRSIARGFVDPPEPALVLFGASGSGKRPLNKMDLIAAVAARVDLPRSRAGALVDAVLGAIEDALRDEEDVRLLGFGTFQRTRRKPSTGRNPRTGGRMELPGSVSVRFRPGKALKDSLR